MKRSVHRIAPAVTALVSAACGQAVHTSAGDTDASGNAWNMRLVGEHRLQGRSAYQPVIHRYGERWVLFAGHHAGEGLSPLTGELERNGMSVIDVTHPANPVLMRHFPPTGPDASGTQHVQVCTGADLPSGDPNKVYLLRTNGQISHEILDVTDPANPEFMTTVVTTGLTDDGVRSTHKNWWDCESGIGYLISTVRDWAVPRVLQAFDLSNPMEPKHIRDFALVGMHPDAGSDPADATGIHHPVVVGNRIYLGYGSSRNGVLQILDRDKFLNGDPEIASPFAPTKENLLFPQIARLDMPTFWGTHTAKPVLGVKIEDHPGDPGTRERDFLIVVSEASSTRCRETRHAMFMLDITQEDKPYPVSSFQVPDEPGSFCNRGGRFGPHAQHDAFHPAFDKNLVLLSYFNAGVRAVDIRDPFRPTEVGFFIPDVNDTTRPSCIEVDGKRECDTVIQTNNVNIDDRGYVYLLDRAGAGLHIVELTGDAAAIVGRG
jgi:hypothetical protein